MSFPPVRTRHRTVLELQFQPLSPDGVLVYMAQRLSARAGELVAARRFTWSIFSLWKYYVGFFETLLEHKQLQNEFVH